MKPDARLTQDLAEVYEEMKIFRRDLAFGKLLTAFEQAAQAGVTLDAGQHARLQAIKALILETWPLAVFGVTKDGR